jgi:hypothetical protein
MKNLPEVQCKPEPTLLDRLESPHEWGYRDTNDDSHPFICDNTPCVAAVRGSLSLARYGLAAT